MADKLTPVRMAQKLNLKLNSYRRGKDGLFRRKVRFRSKDGTDMVRFVVRDAQARFICEERAAPVASHTGLGELRDRFT